MKNNWLKKIAMLAVIFTLSALGARAMDGVMMKDGKMMVMKDGQAMMLDSDMTMSNGTVVTKDGNVTTKSGKTMMLKDGQMISMQGKMMRHKMPMSVDGVIGSTNTMAMGMNSTNLTDCVMMENGKMTVMKAGQTMAMDSDMTMSNGTMVTKDGKVTLNTGGTTMMKDGQMMTMDGNMMDIPKTGKAMDRSMDK